MKRTLLLPAVLALAAVTTPAFARPTSSAPAPLPALPGEGASAADGTRPPGLEDAQPLAQPLASGAAPAAATPQQIYERVRRGIVELEHNGVPVAIGTVLDGDGRILTSLSGLGGADSADVRYADGTSAHAKVGHSDKGTDLALLIPQTGRWTEGLVASESEPVGAPIRAMLPARGVRIGPAEASVKGRVDVHAREGEALPPMLDVDVKGPLVAGAPLLDANGGVVGILVRACKGAAPAPPPPDPVAWAAWANTQDGAAKTAPAVSCTPAVLGAPVSAIRAFLATTPASATVPAPWLGIRGESAQDGAVRGVRVLAVAPSSPAQKAALRPNADVIVAADGKPIDTPEKLADAIGKHAPGETVKLLVFGDDKFREVAIGLRQAP